MSAVTRNQVFSAVHTIGGLLPADMLVRISEGKDVDGSRPADYRVVGSRSVSDEAERHWDYLKSVWVELREKLPRTPEAETPPDPTGLAVTQWLVPLFAELGFGELTTIGAAGIYADGGDKTFPISHRWNHVPMHFAAWHYALDKRPGGQGTVPPQSLVQECLNRTEAHLWAVLTNGRQLRLLRDSSSLATASYVEFDLEAIFDGELFSEFVLLYRLLHVSRFVIADGATPATCWLEKWRLAAITSGTRALDQLRDGVEKAITTLGTGFLRHPGNGGLRADVDVTALHNALLRMVYRLLFVFVAEDREALHTPDATEQARQRYARYFSTARLRAHARRRRGTAHDDLYRALRIVLDALGDENGRPELGLPGLGGIFDDTEADAPLRGLSLSNEYLLAAVRHLAQVRDTGSRRLRAVDYQHLDAEELGSIYESLLERIPRHSAAERTFELVVLAGNERKTTGSYYTPSSLIDCLLNSTLDPVIDDAVKRGEQTASAAGEPDPSEAIGKELLSLTICDPACGSGHFLVAAARRIAKRLAAVREHNPEPTVDAVRHALHEVIARCIYGVDLNPMAVELAKVSLWLEALEPGKPLSFLDAHVKCGNSLVGATPAFLLAGIPDEAFKPIEGDDKDFAKSLAKRNKKEREGQYSLFELNTETGLSNAEFAESVRQMMKTVPGELPEVRLQEADYREFSESADYRHALHVADAWCAAFLWRKDAEAPPAVTQKVLAGMLSSRGESVSDSTNSEIVRLRDKYRFFHWYLEFPEVFAVSEDTEVARDNLGWNGGFDCLLGNPPWERIAFDDEEFFSPRAPEILSNATTDARKKFIKDELARGASWRKEYENEVRRQAELSHFFANSGIYPLTARGRLKTQALFSSLFLDLNASAGWSGIIVTTSVLTDIPMKEFWESLRDSGFLRGVLDCENSDGLFPTVHRSTKFTLLTLQQKNSNEASELLRIGTYLKSEQELGDPDRIYSLPLRELTDLNPITKQLPICRSRRDFELLVSITKSGKPGLTVTPWVGFTSEGFSSHYRDHPAANSVKLIEGKMVHQFDARFADYATGSIAEIGPSGKTAPIIPRYYCSKSVIDDFLNRKGIVQDWIMVVRDYVRATDSRTAIAGVVPRTVPIQPLNGFSVVGDIEQHAWALAAINSFPYDFMAKQKTPNQHFNVTIMKQIPVVDVVDRLLPFVCGRVLELCYVTGALTPFARDLGDTGAPFVWDEERRAVIRSELDALFFHLYAISREDIGYILDTFPIVKRKDEAKYGTYRTKDLILAEYDRMAQAGVNLTTPLIDGENYTSTLNPPPGHGPRHPARSGDA
ncbi:N-6 DNA methylase [Nocardia sp. CA2R105]|uniref:Eco57I restriction-modification methylase domain-containing protein n=1 Tax=Nocardia coffeae TaxID=2873381 RepID=UPI001CA6AAF3|nr:DNA methyltransferase [Nocardia coffeae]MBY8855414.1 N-6 DNA methylase [Nocardia coffeae]